MKMRIACVAGLLLSAFMTAEVSAQSIGALRQAEVADEKPASGGAESETDKFPDSFVVQSAGTDQNGCWMNLVEGNTVYGVRSTFIRCRVMAPGETIHGRWKRSFLGGSEIQVTWMQNGKEKHCWYQVSSTLLLSH